MRHTCGTGTDREGGGPVDLRITNQTEYRAWNIFINGIKRKTNGAFGVVNLQAPREAAQKCEL